MKNVALVMVASLFGMMAIAPAFADNLAGIMDDMASNLKTIAKQSADASQNSSSAALCDKVIADIAQAQTFTPDAISKLPADQQTQAEQGYVTLLGQLSDQFKALKTDFTSGNNAQATADIAKINATKAQGHKQYQ